MNIKQIVTGAIQENCYLIDDNQTMLIVDPGSDADKIKAEIAASSAKPVAILITHTHYDHIGAVEAIRHEYNIPVYVSPIEQEWLTDPKLNFSGLMNHNDIEDIIVQPAEHLFEMGQTLTFGDLSFKVVPTPGHSPGSVSFIFAEFVITGDALFRGSIGRTDLPFGDMEQLKKGIKAELFTLPDDLRAYPGHGPVTSIGREKKMNPFFN